VYAYKNARKKGLSRFEKLSGAIPKKITTTIGVHGESIIDELGIVNPLKSNIL
jgi:hypothetical protein